MTCIFMINSARRLRGGQLTGSWQPDGRTISPLSAAASFDSASQISLDAFNGHDPNGSWTLFIADVSAGGGQSQLTSWELDITAVPEPINLALGAFGAALFVRGVIGLYRLKGAKVRPLPATGIVSQPSALSAQYSAWRRAVNAWVDAV